MKYRKDATPIETINRILFILKECKIKVKWHFYKFANLFYSCRVFIKDYPLIGTNGKGLNKDLALASGLSEFMERLQTFNLIKPMFCSSKLELNGIITQQVNHDDIYPVKQSYPKLKALLPDIYHECIEYQNVITKDLVYVPYLYISSTCGTNGLCAGNSYYEALSQGICEVLERYCVRQYFLHKTILKTIDPNSLFSDILQDDISKLKALGLNVLIKDLSFGIYPVIGVIVLDSENNYIFAAGCDTDIEIAIQRCFTEIFQGLTLKNYHSKFHKFANSVNTIDNFHKMFRNNNADLDKTILLGETIDAKTLPFRSYTNNKQVLDYLIEIVTKNHGNIYVKNYSFLGFNTYHIYIPEMSEINSFNLDLIKNKVFLNRAMFDSQNIDSTYMDNFSSVIDKTQFSRCGEFFNLDLMFKEDINNINSRGFKIIVTEGYNQKSTYFNTLNFDLPASTLYCKKCFFKKKCYYTKWKQYFNILKNKLGNYEKNINY